MEYVHVISIIFVVVLHWFPPLKRDKNWTPKRPSTEDVKKAVANLEETIFLVELAQETPTLDVHLPTNNTRGVVGGDSPNLP